jgi:hydrogenase maturation factor
MLGIVDVSSVRREIHLACIVDDEHPIEMVHGPGCPVCVLPMGRSTIASHWPSTRT